MSAEPWRRFFYRFAGPPAPGVLLRLENPVKSPRLLAAAVATVAVASVGLVPAAASADPVKPLPLPRALAAAGVPVPAALARLSPYATGLSPYAAELPRYAARLGGGPGGGLSGLSSQDDQATFVARMLVHMFQRPGRARRFADQLMSSGPKQLDKYLGVGSLHRDRFTVTMFGHQACAAWPAEHRPHAFAGPCMDADRAVWNTPLTDTANVLSFMVRTVLKAGSREGHGMHTYLVRELYRPVVLKVLTSAVTWPHVRVQGAVDRNGDHIDDDARLTLRASNGRAVCLSLPVRRNNTVMTYGACDTLPARHVSYPTLKAPFFAQRFEDAVNQSAAIARGTSTGYEARLREFKQDAPFFIPGRSSTHAVGTDRVELRTHYDSDSYAACVTLPGPDRRFAFTRGYRERPGTWHMGACR